VGGGVPSASRAAALTAEAARNGLGLGILEGIVRLSLAKILPRCKACCATRPKQAAGDSKTSRSAASFDLPQHKSFIM